MAADKTKYRLIYYNVKGRCEPIRYIFAAAQVHYEDMRVSEAEWQEIKPKTPFGGMPILEVSDRTIAQSTSIARYVARECGLAGKTNLDAALADSIVDTALEIRENHMVPFVHEKDEAKKNKIIENFAGNQLPQILGNFDKLLGDQDFFVNNELSWADIVVMSMLEMLIGPLGTVVDRYPRLRALEKRVRSLPGIAAYIENRPVTKL